MSTGTAVKKHARYTTQTNLNDSSSRVNAFEADAGSQHLFNRYSAVEKMPHDVSPYLLTVKQTATRLQLGINCVYALTKTEYNPLPTIVIGRSIRIPVAALERWLEAQTHG